MDDMGLECYRDYVDENKLDEGVVDAILELNDSEPTKENKRRTMRIFPSGTRRS